jgi:hypothetical protein
MVIVSALTYVSCNDTFDNIKDFNVKEIVYPGHFDTILATIGFERVEIDLCQAGRIPSAQMNLGKATQTVVEFTNNGRDTTVIFPGVRSWVDITGLSQPNMYQFKVYAADEYGNRSKPVEVSASPYTQSDLDALVLPDPSIYASTTAAQVEWKTSISSRVYDVLNWSYSYTDRDGNVYDGSGEGDMPVFFVRNVTPGTPATVYVTSRIIPRLNDVPILDEVDWTYPLKVTLGTRPIIFLDEPAVGALFEDDETTFSWFKVDESDGYLLKISNSKGFPNNGQTLSIPVGNVDSYTVKWNEVTPVTKTELYWTVVPATAGTNVIGQVRSATQNNKVNRKLSKSGWVATASSEYAWGSYGGSPAMLLDNDVINSGWHTNLSAALPHWVLIDMQTPQTFGRIDIWELDNTSWRYMKDIEIYTSDSPDQASWQLLMPYSDDVLWPVQTIIGLDVRTTTRYLAIKFLTSRTTPNTYISCSEIDFYDF